MVTGYSLPNINAVADAAELGAGFEWRIPRTYNIAAEVIEWADEPGSRRALSHVDDAGIAHEFEYTELAAASERAAAALAADGISTDDRVALCAPQSPETIVLHLAAYRIGAVIVPLSVLFGDETFTHVVETSGATSVWLDVVAAERFDDALDSLDGVSSTVFELAANEYAGERRALGGLAEHTGSEAIASIAETAPDDPALFVTTSGTSGPPKCVVQSHQYLIGTLPGYQLWYELFEDSHEQQVWTPASWAWAGALFDVVFPTLAMGGIVCSRARRSGFDPEAALAYVDRAGVSRAFVPATALRRIRRGTDPASFDLGSLEVVLCGGEFLAEALKQWGEDALDTTINVGYGLTEANALIGHCRALYPDRGDSIGVPYPGHEMTIIDGDGERVPAGEIGEIALEPPDPVLFRGYWRDGEIDESPDESLFYTGDRGYRDADGYYYYEGRSDSVIISSGYRVSPREIERVLEDALNVQEAVVGGIVDGEFGERIVAYVVSANSADGAGDRIDTDDLTQRVRDRLGKHKVPHEIHELRDPPQTHSGKVDRSELFAE
jgi:acetyl-CoA synthetase